MKFSYDSLKQAAKTGERLGKWNGYPVYSASYGRLANLGSGAYYVIFDDDNYIVRRTDDTHFYAYGKVDWNGNVNEFNSRELYWWEEVPKEDPKPKAAVYEAEETVGDVKLGIDVDATLKNAREMTVDSLLEGFNYGLES